MPPRTTRKSARSLAFEYACLNAPTSPTGALFTSMITSPGRKPESDAGLPGGYKLEMEALGPIGAEIVELDATSEDDFAKAARDADALYAVPTAPA